MKIAHSYSLFWLNNVCFCVVFCLEAKKLLLSAMHEPIMPLLLIAMRFFSLHLPAPFVCILPRHLILHLLLLSNRSVLSFLINSLLRIVQFHRCAWMNLIVAYCSIPSLRMDDSHPKHPSVGIALWSAPQPDKRLPHSAGGCLSYTFVALTWV
ncbi:MAG: hypothetical protein MJZ67_00635 [Bacteroidales bacterium]|nr:hypothetical protein [Bacteroidales bacterium]